LLVHAEEERACLDSAGCKSIGELFGVEAGLFADFAQRRLLDRFSAIGRALREHPDAVAGASGEHDLQVVAPGNRKMVDAKDQDIEKAVKARLSKDMQVKTVDVRTDSGVVTLTGEVPSIVAAAKASEMARGVPGVKSVKNELTVRQASKK